MLGLLGGSFTGLIELSSFSYPDTENRMLDFFLVACLRSGG